MRCLLLIIGVFFSCVEVSGQVGSDETVIPKSPNAAALDKLDFAPVELATGGVNVSYNLYDIKTRSFSIPVPLRYHSGGIKVDEISSWVGLGWSLDAGGLISRKINGNPDEGLTINSNRKYYLFSSTLGPVNQADGPWGYDTSAATKQHYIDLYVSLNRNYGILSTRYENTEPLYKLADQTGNWGGYTNAAYMQAGLGSYPPLYQDIQTVNADPNLPALPTNDNLFTSNLIDPQPDEFSIRIPGYTGKFSFNNLGVPQLYPVDKDLKISFVSYPNINETGSAPYIDTWMISTPEGKQYYFGYGDNSKTTADGSPGTRSAWVSNPYIEWMLTKIVDVNTKDSILFAYKQERAFTGRKYKQYIWPNDNASLEALGDGTAFDGPDDQQAPDCSASVLTKITTIKETVNFYSNFSPLQLTQEPEKLDSIVIVDNSNGKVYGRFNLNYDFFRMSKKLKLVSFQKKSLDQINYQPPTIFSYYDTTVGAKSFGPYSVQYTSLAQDYWGYYNNAQQNYAGYLIMPDAVNATGKSRKPAWPFMQLGVLNKITSPTGGQTVFEYEPHTASSLNNLEVDEYNPDNPFSMDTIGGLRIKKMMMVDSVRKTKIIHRYSYNYANGISSGHLNITPSVTQRISEALCISSFFNDYILLSNFNRTPLHNYGNVVNYGRVTEETVDTSGNSNGYTVSTFFNDANATDTNYLSYISSIPTQRYAFNGLGNMPGWQSHHSLGVNLSNGMEIERSVYTKDSFLIQKQSNEYGIKQLPGYIGGFNFFGRSADALCDVMAHPPINDYDRTTATVDNTRPTTPIQHNYYYIKYYAEYPKIVQLSKRTNTEYSHTGESTTNVQELYYESPYHLNTTRTVSYNSKGDTLSTVNLYAFDFADNMSGDTVFKQMKTLYFNPLIAATTFKGSQISSSKVTKYQNFGTSSIPAIYPAISYLHRANSLATPLQTYGSNNTVTYPITNYFSDNNFTIEESYNFAANGTLKQRDKLNDFSSSYLWDYNAQLPIAEASNAKNDDIAYTSFEAEGNGNWTIGSALRDSITATITGKKSYDLGNGSISKSNLTLSKNYIVSYWSQSGNKTISGGTGSVTTGRSAKGWTYYEHKIKTSSTTLTLSGSGLIDELKLYPLGSLMNTIVYDPLIGQTSTADPNSEITYYEYDGFNRLKDIKDYQGNIVKNFQYNYQNSCGDNCVVLPMQTFTAYNTPSYPVGVFNVNKQFIDTARTPAEYVTKWNSNSANQAIGVLSINADSLHFNLSLVTGATAPPVVFGLRYYQWDAFSASSMHIGADSLCFVDWGDGNRELLTQTRQYFTEGWPYGYITSYLHDELICRWIDITHSYATTGARTITVYHNETVKTGKADPSWPY